MSESETTGSGTRTERPSNFPFKSGMAMGNGVKIYGNKNVVILEQSIDDYTKIQIHHHNKGPGALDVLPSTYEINPYTGKRIPVSRIVG